MARGFLALLRSELARRCEKNEAYSLRAFARDLEIDHATLSQLLRGRRELSPSTVERLGRGLGLSEALLGEFVAEAGTPSSEHAHNLTAEAARILVEPLHEAILDIVDQDGFTPDTRILARALDTDVDAVNVAVQRLLRLGLLVMASSERWTSRLEREAGSFDLAVWKHVSKRLMEDTRMKARDTASANTSENPVRQFQLVARDPAATAEFYTRLFGWTVDDANPLGYRRIVTGPSGIDGGIWPAPPDVPSFLQLFVAVADVPRTVERAAELGARVIVPPQELPGGDCMAVLADPDGLSFGVFRASSEASRHRER